METKPEPASGLEEGKKEGAGKPASDSWGFEAYVTDEFPTEEESDVSVEYKDFTIALDWDTGWQLPERGMLIRNFTHDTVTYVKRSGMNVTIPASSPHTDILELADTLEAQADMTDRTSELLKKAADPNDERRRLFSRDF